MSILAIDRWRKRLWVAYVRWKDHIIFPVWSVDNDKDCIYSMAHIVAQHNIQHIIIWYPKQEVYLQKAIDAFITQLTYVISPECTIEKVDEEYSSVQAWAVLWNFKKTAAEDTLAAVKILEEYLKHAK